MQPTEWIWHKGEFVKWDDAKVHFLTHSLHYGDGAFEGIRAYETKRGAAIFRLREHMERLVSSAQVLRMKLPYSVDELCTAAVETVSKNRLKHCYIRPLAYYDYGVMGLNPRDSKAVVSIACWPWGAYLPHDMVDVKVSDFIRIHPRSTISSAKICGHYVNSILSCYEVQGTKYHEAILCDLDGNIMEGPGENFFAVINGTLTTPPLQGILPGITRATVIQLARDLGIPVEEKSMKVDDALKGQEAFYTGTAAEVTPVRSINDRNFGNGTIGPVTKQIRELYLSLVRGEEPKYQGFLTYVD